MKFGPNWKYVELLETKVKCEFVVLRTFFLVSVLICNGCTRTPLIESPPSLTTRNLLDDKLLLIIGQDLESVSAYVDSGYFPVPGGVTTYLAFYQLMSSVFPAFGALGQDVDGNAMTSDVDWGAGPLNATRLANQNPDSALVIGLNIAEGNSDRLWAPGGLANIAIGIYDEHIRRLARFCIEIERPVYLRIGYEFDGVWNRGYEKQTSYILAYRRIVDVMREEQVKNVAYVWQASASPIDDIIDGHHEDIRDWYPGDDYVDWMGLSWFLAPDEKLADVATQRQLADELVRFAREKNKPVMIAESAPQGYDLERLTRAKTSHLWKAKSGPEKLGLERESITADVVWQDWFMPYLEYIHDNADTIRAVAYINADWDAQRMWTSPYHQGYWGDSRVQINSVIREKWLQEISDKTFWQQPGGQ